MKKNNKTIEAANGCRINVKETRKVNEKFVLTLKDANYNKIIELKCGAKDYDKTIKELMLLAEEQVDDNEELVYEAEIALDKNNKPNFEELKQLGNEVKDLLNALEKEETKLENEIKKEEVKEEEPKKEEVKEEEVKVEKPKKVEVKVEEPKKEKNEFELPLLEEDEGEEYNFQFGTTKEEVKVEEPKKEEVKVEKPKKVEVKVEEVKVEEVKVEEVKVEEPKKEEVKVEEPKKEEVKVEEPKKEKKTKIVKTVAKVAIGAALLGVALFVGKAPIKAAARCLFNIG